jgi:hypothetical protein
MFDPRLDVALRAKDPARSKRRAAGGPGAPESYRVADP